ncbi:MAG: hypothetical protein JNG85_02215 [Spirochaetaceae bacterium]|nr:hypothetical protein [Spirochaetaceae bacterium]
MAAQISHILAGEEALRLADPSLAGELLADEAENGCGQADAAWFRLGCQGPDIFYHNQRTKPSGLHYGSLAHRRNYGLIVEGALESLLGDKAELRDGAAAPGGELRLGPGAAYLLGFATHAALDRATHPFIVYFSGWAKPGDVSSARYRGCHPFLERVLDLALLAELRGLGPADFDLEALLPLEGRGGQAEAATAAIVRLLVAGLQKAFPRAAASDFLLARRIENALSDARYFFRATNPARTAGARADYFAYLDDRAGPKSIALVYPEALPAGVDFLNRARRPWRHPAGDGRASDLDYAALYLRGAEEGARAIGLVLAALRSGGPPNGLAAFIGNGGLSIADEAGIPLPPLVSDPLPLPELMDAEFKTRLELARRSLGGSSPAAPPPPIPALPPESSFD